MTRCKGDPTERRAVCPDDPSTVELAAFKVVKGELGCSRAGLGGSLETELNEFNLICWQVFYLHTYASECPGG